MKTLYLMRHAKSDWPNADPEDHDRGLASRGKRAAKRMAGYMAAERLRPDLILCSTARRAHKTVDALLKTFGQGTPVQYRRTLYFTSPDVILDEIREVADSVETLLVMGHNPDTQAMAVHLAADAHDRNVGAMARKFPTAALAIFSFDTSSWRDVGWGSGTIEAFVRPKALPDRA